MPARAIVDGGSLIWDEARKLWKYDHAKEEHDQGEVGQGDTGE